MKTSTLPNTCFQLGSSKARLCLLVLVLTLETSVLSAVCLGSYFPIFILFGDFAVEPSSQVQCRNAVKHSECKKSMICLTEKIPVCTKLCSGASYNAVGSDSNVNESTIYIKWPLNSNIPKLRLHMDWLTKILSQEILRNLTLHFFL